LRGCGIPLADIVVLSARGHGRSRLPKVAKMGGVRAAEVSGALYGRRRVGVVRGRTPDRVGTSVQGTERHGVVLAEVDFKQLDEASAGVTAGCKLIHQVSGGMTKAKSPKAPFGNLEAFRLLEVGRHTGFEPVTFGATIQCSTN
jgi:hypothetical protein